MLSRILRFILPLLLLASIFIVAYIHYKTSTKNIVNNSKITWGVGWEKGESHYSGSELSFSFDKSTKISFEINTDSDANQGVDIYIDEKLYSMTSPNLSNQRLTITLDENKPYTVLVRHFCSFLVHPCQIRIKGIYLDNKANITNYQKHSKVLSVIGDSISSVYGRDNFTQILANRLGYELHNASIAKSTVTETEKENSAIERYKKDLTSFKSDVIIIFLGSNDAAQNVPLNTFERDYRTIAAGIKAYNPEGKILLVGLLPREDVNWDVIQNYNSTIESIAQELGVNYIDTTGWLMKEDFVDGIHPFLEKQAKLSELFYKSLSSKVIK